MANLVGLAGWAEGGWLGGLVGGGGAPGSEAGGHRAAGVQDQRGVGAAASAGGQQGEASGTTVLQGGIAAAAAKEGAHARSGAGPEGAVVDVPLPLPRAVREAVRSSVPALANLWGGTGARAPPLALTSSSQTQSQMQTQPLCQQQVPGVAPAPAVAAAAAPSWGAVGDLLGDDLPAPALPFPPPSSSAPGILPRLCLPAVLWCLVGVGVCGALILAGGLLGLLVCPGRRPCLLLARLLSANGG